MPTQKKVETVNELANKLDGAKTIVFTDYRGLTHKQLEELRRSLKKLQAHYLITKNTLISRALASVLQTPESIEAELSGPTATLIASGDEVAPLKELAKMMKATELPKIKFGFLGQTKLSGEEVIRLSTLPTKTVLIGQLVGSMKSPLFGLHNALSWNLRKLVYAFAAIKKQKS